MKRMPLGLKVLLLGLVTLMLVLGVIVRYKFIDVGLNKMRETIAKKTQVSAYKEALPPPDPFKFCPVYMAKEEAIHYSVNGKGREIELYDCDQDAKLDYVYVTGPKENRYGFAVVESEASVKILTAALEASARRGVGGLPVNFAHAPYVSRNSAYGSGLQALFDTGSAEQIQEAQPGLARIPEKKQ